MEERKIRITNIEEAEKKLLSAGAIFQNEMEASDTYYKQPEGHVLKVTENDYGKFLIQLVQKGGKFEVTRHEKIEKPRELKNALKERYGRDIILDKKRRRFEWKEYNLGIYIIEDVGDFLIVKGEVVQDSLFAELGFDEPEFVEFPFSELAKEI